MLIATHLITGFLGAGKTTTLRHLLRELKGRGERTAVLVNEFGALGIDGTLLSETPNVSVREIPDGCICCTLAGRLLEALREIAQAVRPDRLFVEPTGLARPHELKRLFLEDGVANQYRLGPVLTLVDPCTYLKIMARNLPFYADQIREADVVVANKLDCVSPEDLARFRADLPRLNARARLIETRYGEVPLDALTDTPPAQGEEHSLSITPASSSQGGENFPMQSPQTQAQGHAHGAAQGERLGFSKDAEVCFRVVRLRRFFLELNAGIFGAKPWRAKGLFHCQDGWRLFQLSESGVDETADAPSPGDNRCEIIAERLDQGMRDRLSAALEACVMAIPGSMHRGG